MGVLLQYKVSRPLLKLRQLCATAPVRLIMSTACQKLITRCCEYRSSDNGCRIGVCGCHCDAGQVDPERPVGAANVLNW